MRKARFGFPPLIGWCLAGALAFAGCTSEGAEGETGSVGLNIDLGGTDGGLTINEVQWVIVDVPDLNPVAQGVVNVSQPESTASFEYFGLFPGAYGVQLTATSTDGRTTCVGQAGPFNILAGQSTAVAVLLNCMTEERLGAVRIDGTFNRCAELTTVTVSPLQVAVGFDIDVAATADDDEGDAIAYRWTGAGGSFADASAATTTFTCEATGTQNIIVEVSDDAAPLPSFSICIDSWTVPVECVPAPNCGNGVIDPGEDCDPPNGVDCDSDCQRIATCGDGTVDPGEDCDPPDGVFCDAQCQDIDPCSPNPCDDGNGCTQNLCSADPNDNSAICDFSQTEDDGTLCDDLQPNSAGSCVGGVCQPIPDPITATVPLICSNSVSPADISYLPNELVAAPTGPVVNANPVNVSFTGTAFFPAAFLNAAVGFGFTTADVTGANATVAVRSGAAGGPLVLNLAQPLPLTVQIPIVNDDGQCQAAGFPSAPCVLEDLALPLSTDSASLTPNGGAGGEILVGWDESVDPTTLPLPLVPQDPPGANGLRVSVGLPVPVGLECTMGECTDATNTCIDGTDSGQPLADSDLLSIPIAP